MFDEIFKRVQQNQGAEFLIYEDMVFCDNLPLLIDGKLTNYGHALLNRKKRSAKYISRQEFIYELLHSSTKAKGVGERLLFEDGELYLYNGEFTDKPIDKVLYLSTLDLSNDDADL